MTDRYRDVKAGGPIVGNVGEPTHLMSSVQVDMTVVIVGIQDLRMTRLFFLNTNTSITSTWNILDGFFFFAC